jgi:hypothetical protein
VFSESFDEGELERIEPDFCDAIVVADMDMRGFKAIRHVKEKAVSCFAKNGGHPCFTGEAEGWFVK